MMFFFISSKVLVVCVVESHTSALNAVFFLAYGFKNFGCCHEWIALLTEAAFFPFFFFFWNLAIVSLLTILSGGGCYDSKRAGAGRQNLSY